MSGGALAGLKVLDFGQIVAGGHLSAMLADFGATVVKVESLAGESLRKSGPFEYGMSSYFAQENRGKKSLCIDLKNPEAIDIIKQLIPKFDVIIENLRPGAMAKFGLDYPSVRQIKEDIIYLSISGFGQNNSHTMEPAYDIVLQAATGLSMQTGTKESGPMRVPASVADYTAALNGGVALLAAVLHHSKTGEGQYIDIAMYDSLIASMDNSYTTWEMLAHQGHTADDRAVLEESGLVAGGNGHPGTCPHGYYPTKEGDFVAHMSLSEKMWQAICGVIERPDLVADPTLAGPDLRRKQRARVDGAISAWTREHTTEEVISAFMAAKLPVAKVRSVAEAYQDPHNQQRGIFSPISQGAGEVLVANFPGRLSVTPAKIAGPAPELGEHTSQILEEYLGLSQDDVASLKARRVVG